MVVCRFRAGVWVLSLGVAMLSPPAMAGTLPADGRVFVNDATWPAGATDQTLFVRAAYDQFTVYGYSVALHYDETVLAVKSVTWEDVLSEEPDYFEGIAEGGEIGYTCVIDFFFSPDRVLPPSNDQPLIKATFDVLAAVDTTTQIDFDDVPINPEYPTRNVLTDEGGNSRFPEVSTATITVEDRTPVINQLVDNDGQADDTFFVVGQFFGEPNLAITVCGVAASATLLGDGQTLSVIAPACVTSGWASIEVCTDRGCDTDTNGFFYIAPPVIESLANNQGPPGTVFKIVGQNFDEPDLSVSVCGAAAAFSLEPDGSLSVTAPDCPDLGLALVAVCNTFGCDDEPAGFFYRTPPSIALLQNNSGLAGTQFTIIGDHFDGPNLNVVVCGSAATAVLQPDGNILATAPDCDTVGPEDVEVCTDYGCDTAAGGFFYEGPPPMITGFQNNQGRAGDVFTIFGEEFDRPLLAVTVCDVAASFALQPDGSIMVTAPSCATIGAATVRVCTAYGCTEDPQGFDYLGPPPVITGFESNEGRSGDTFTVFGTDFDAPNLAVTVCGANAVFVSQPDNSLLVTAPDCATLGAARVEVCTVWGCDSDPQGFTYFGPPPVITGFEDNFGFAGQEFVILGDNFDAPNLAVTVCGAVASFALLASGDLRVTAPACGSIGPANVEVCTDYGCDNDPQGFDYRGPSPVILGFEDNEGMAGDVFKIIGENFAAPNLRVSICSVFADHTLLPDGRLEVTAPPCGIGGEPVEVCTDYGCDDDPQGFEYLGPPPVITGFENNQGRAGDSFVIVGEHFGHDNLSVRVCGRDVEFVEEAANRLRVTAPTCETVGAAAVEVCTIWGCDFRSDGFTYEPPPPAPRITLIRGNQGQAGDVFIVEGESFDGPNLTVTVCGEEADFGVVPDTPHHLEVTTPPCATLGWAALEVCTDHGCDRAEEGFEYIIVTKDTAFIRADANCDGIVNIADPVYTLNFLFLTASPPCCDAAADSNADGGLDVSDPLYTLNHQFLGGFPPPPHPFPSCGTVTGVDECAGHPCGL